MSTQVASEIVSYAKHGDVAVITMDDGKANALSPAMLEQLGAAIDRASGEAKAVVLAGRPGRFSAGFDLRVMMAGPAEAKGMVMAGGELLMRLYELPLPVVVACTGHALAAGVLLVCTGDVRLGVRGDFKLGLNEVQNGMPVPILAHELARDRLATHELEAAVLHARIYDPDGAARAGYLDRAVEPDELAAEALREAERLAKLPNSAYAATKRSLRRKTIEYVRNTLDTNLADLTGQR